MSNITKLYLLNVPLEADYKHTIFFEAPDIQERYFKGHAVGTKFKYDDFSYQRKDNKIRIPEQFDKINGKTNYVMYQNTAYNDKWFYAFIVDIQYVSDGVTDVYIKTDVMQTWYFDYELKSCFVEREHTKDDTEGANTVPEGLETGEYICNSVIHDNSMSHTCYIVASAVELTGDNKGADSGLQIYNRVINGWYYYFFETGTAVEDYLDNLAELRTNDAIVSIFVMPTNYLYKGQGHKLTQNHVVKDLYWSDFSGGDDIVYGDKNELIYKPETVNGYKPKNRKLLTYPYSYLLMDNNSGGTAMYQYELFNIGSDDKVCDFKLVGAVTPSGSIRLIPLHYSGIGENDHFGLNAGKFPICGWQSDYYTNWLTQNALNLEVQTRSIALAGGRDVFNSGMQVANGAMGLATGITAMGTPATAGLGASMTGNGAIGMAQGLGNMAFGVAQTLNQIQGITAQKEIHAFQSPTVRGSINSGDVNFVDGKLRFSAYQMSVKSEFAKIIDNYFSMYGYQTNRVKVPNYNHRSRYWYTKTVGCEIDGAIPNNDMQAIKSCYNNGITFWRDPDEIGRYTEGDNDELKDNAIELWRIE